MEISELYQRFIASGSVVTTDSRTAAGLFFALRGDRFDGHDFALSALSAGAAYAVVDHSVAGCDPARLIVVADTIVALQQLAAYHRTRLNIPIIGLTGTNGKTTTKELLTAVLRVNYHLGATKGNLNNHLGVPQTLLSFTPQTEIGIVEMGANHPGEIDFLCRIAMPDYGLITNVGRAHLEGFGSFEGVKQTKSELYRYIAWAGGHLFYNAEDELLSALIASCDCPKTAYRVPFTNINSIGGTLSYDFDRTTYRTHLAGEYNVNNIAAALAVGMHFGVPASHALQAVADYTPTNNRSQVVETRLNTVYMDAYNANPSSMEAALRTFATLEHDHKTLILGHMGELGTYAAEEHRKLVALIRELGFDDVYLVGEEFARVNGGGGDSGDFQWFGTTEQLAVYLREHPLERRCILVKGSHSVALETMITLL